MVSDSLLNKKTRMKVAVRLSPQHKWSFSYRINRKKYMYTNFQRFDDRNKLR